MPFPKWRLARDQACALLLSGENLLLVTGPSGTGKTLLLEDCARVLRSIGWQVSFYVPGTPFERDVASDGEPKVLLVDDAERLSEADLLFLRFSKHGPVVLAGSQTLEQSCPGCTTIKLRPLDLKEATAFIKLWCAQAGEGEPPLDEAAVLRLLTLSAGIPRLLAILLGAGTWRGEAARAVTVLSPRIEESVRLEISPPLAAPETAASFGSGQLGIAATSPVQLASSVAAPKKPRARRRRVLAGQLGLAVLLCVGGFMAAQYDWRVPGVVRQQANQLWAYTLPLRSLAQDQFDRIVRLAAPPPSPLPPPETRMAEPAPVRVPEPHVVPPPAPAAPTSSTTGEAETSAPPPPVAAAPPAPAPVEPTPAPITLPPAAVATAPPAVDELSPAIVETLLRRGTEMMSLGDYSAARLLFARAAKSGNVAAMLSLGRTYDPAQLTGAGTAAAADREAARRWYRQAQVAGSQEATDLLRTLDQGSPK